MYVRYCDYANAEKNKYVQDWHAASGHRYSEEDNIGRRRSNFNTGHRIIIIYIL